MTLPMSLDADAAAAVLAWYDRHRRELPWRVPPGEAADPYKVWLSEIMLQQTTVTAVKPYFAAFLSLWPNVGLLAEARSEEVMRAGLGLVIIRARAISTPAQKSSRSGTTARFRPPKQRCGNCLELALYSGGDCRDRFRADAQPPSMAMSRGLPRGFLRSTRRFQQRCPRSRQK